MRKAFATVDKLKRGYVESKDIESIFNSMGTAFDVEDLNETIKRVDIDSKFPLSVPPALPPIFSRLFSIYSDGQVAFHGL